MSENAGPGTVNVGPGGLLDLDNLFTYHAPRGPEQIAKFQRIRNAGKEFAKVLVLEVPSSPERSKALSDIRQSVFWANAGVAIHDKDSDAEPDSEPKP